MNADVQEVRRLVQATDAHLGDFRYVRRDSVACIVDALFVVETWRDAGGVLRKLSFSQQGLLSGGSTVQNLYRDAQGRPRYLQQLDGNGLDRSRPVEGQHPAAGSTELFIGRSGQVVARSVGGDAGARQPVAWPQVLAELNPQRLFKQDTCQR